MAGSHLANGSEEEQQGIMLMMTTTATAGDYWEVQYARFFNCPSLFSSAGAGGHHPSLVPLAKPNKGTWISSDPFAHLTLINTTTDHSDNSRSTVLTIALVDDVIEEHYISKLHFTWPQVSCLSGHAPRGSTSVFMSYKDHVGQIQKFAVRFQTLNEAERFINSVKEIFGHERTDGSMPGISKSKTSSQSEISSSQPLNRSTEDWDPISSSADDFLPMYRPTRDWSPIASSADTYIQPIHPSENHDASLNSNPPETTLGQDVQEKLSAFPPSFSSLLMNCCPEAGQAMQPTVPEEASLRKEIMKYLEDSSFQDMLSKVEKVISDFGDDLPL